MAVVATVLLAGACSSRSRYEGQSDEELFRMARAEYEEREWENAIAALDRLVISFGTSPVLPDARMLLAHSYYQKGDYITSRSEYRRFLDRYPGHEDAPYAALGICQSLSALAPEPGRDQTHTEEAHFRCRTVVADFSGHQVAVTAGGIANEMRGLLAQSEYNKADYYYRRKVYDSAIKYYNFVVDSYADTEWAAWAMLGLVRANQAIGYDDQVEVWRERLLQEHPSSEAAQRLANGT